MSDTAVSPGDIYLFCSSHNNEIFYYMVLWRRETEFNAWELLELGNPNVSNWEREVILTDTRYYAKVA